MIYDISQRVGIGAAVWPGDTPYHLAWTMERRHGASVNVSRLRLSPHTGTHADAFLHVEDGAADIASMPLEKYVGEAVVVDARDHVRDGEVGVSALDGVALEGKRVLLRTRDGATPFRFAEEAVAPSLALGKALVTGGAYLLGVDGPSVDVIESKDLPVHQTLRRGGVANLENLVLHHVPPGRYLLVAAPLKLVGADGSPVRAVLLEPGA